MALLYHDAPQGHLFKVFANFSGKFGSILLGHDHASSPVLNLGFLSSVSTKKAWLGGISFAGSSKEIIYASSWSHFLFFIHSVLSLWILSSCFSFISLGVVSGLPESLNRSLIMFLLVYDRIHWRIKIILRAVFPNPSLPSPNPSPFLFPNSKQKFFGKKKWCFIMREISNRQRSTKIKQKSILLTKCLILPLCWFRNFFSRYLF